VFVLLLNYVKPLEEVDALMRDHMRWRTGGVIVARGDDREEIEALAASDPFVSGGVATCEVIHFRASQSAPDLDGLV
jgi:uncharacterized protein YciI